MEAKAASRVGLVVLLSLGLAFVLYTYLGHVNNNTYLVRISFPDTMGLAKQSIVRMQGVEIGEVKSISLNTTHPPFQPVVTVAIDHKYNIPQNFLWRIRSGLLIANAQLDVIAPASPAAALFLPKDNSAQASGQPPQDLLSSVSPQLSQTVGSLKGTMQDVRIRLDGLTGQLHTLLGHTDALVQNANRSLTSAQQMINNPKVKNDLIDTISNFHTVSLQAAITSKQLSKQFTVLVKNGRGQLNRLSDATTSLVLKLGDTLDDAREVVRKLTQQVSDPRLQRSLQETLELGRSTLASVRQITSDLHQITGDPKLHTTVMQTLQNLQSATKRANEALGKVNALLGRVKHTANRAAHLHGPKVITTVDLSQQFSPGKGRLDINSQLYLTPQNFLSLGGYDLGQDTRLNLQGGRMIGKNSDLRLGLHAGAPGVGADIGLLKGTWVTLDLFNLHRTRLDLKGYFRVNSRASLWVGGDNLLHHPVPLAGIQYRP